ncbi:hypothetical protein HZS_5027, partial [Henneguya salminicola]
LNRGFEKNLDVSTSIKDGAESNFNQNYQQISPYDDLKREKLFYDLSLSSVEECFKKTKVLPPPQDCHMKLLKTDEDMVKIKSKIDHLKNVKESKQKLSEIRRMKNFQNKAKNHKSNPKNKVRSTLNKVGKSNQKNKKRPNKISRKKQKNKKRN